MPTTAAIPADCGNIDLLGETLARRLQHVWQRARTDRRVVYALLAIGLIGPLGWVESVPVRPSEGVEQVHAAIEQLPRGSTVLLAADYDPAAAPELQPFVRAALRLAFDRDLNVVAVSLWPQAPHLVRAAFLDVQDSGVRYGRDFVNLGYKAGGLLVISQLGESVAAAYPTDSRQRPVTELPLMAKLGSVADADLLLSVASGSPGTLEWVAQRPARFQGKILAATTSSWVADLKPLVASGQLGGIVDGVMGAAAFEQLVDHPAEASAAMGAVGVGQLVWLLLVAAAAVSGLWRRWQG